MHRKEAHPGPRKWCLITPQMCFDLWGGFRACAHFRGNLHLRLKYHIFSSNWAYLSLKFRIISCFFVLSLNIRAHFSPPTPDEQFQCSLRGGGRHTVLGGRRHHSHRNVLGGCRQRPSGYERLRARRRWSSSTTRPLECPIVPVFLPMP